ncbi:ferrochelatase [Auriculariales sp. MPI-PUGE-AT-0066]|nr:ferrochelatase [Auriculariales sp. MPI-PUGE-AT-0066]
MSSLRVTATVSMRQAARWSCSTSRTRSHAMAHSTLGARQIHSRKAVLMLNMGGPSTIPEVHSFLRNLFLDRDLMRLPAQRLLGPFIAWRRYKSIEEQYEKIGGGSPILRYTREQGERMCELLEELAPRPGGYKNYTGFRYAAPLVHDTMREMRADGVKRVVAFSQYPQYSCSTTGSSLNEVYRSAWSVIDRWGTHTGLVEAEREDTVLLFRCVRLVSRTNLPTSYPCLSAHSLPMSVVNRGDPYIAEVAGTVSAVMQRLEEKGERLSHRLVWQSQVGPQPWMGMQTGEAIKGLAKNGHKRAMLVPVAFTSDHIETLYELDLEYGHVAQEVGIHLTRAPALNTHPVFVRALADIVAEHLKRIDAEEISPVSKQMLLRCPGCTNETCGEQKEWFARGGRGDALEA